jgi:hypothetical protein
MSSFRPGLKAVKVIQPGRLDVVSRMNWSIYEHKSTVTFVQDMAVPGLRMFGIEDHDCKARLSTGQN